MTQVSSTHPPYPPTTEEDRLDRLRLLRSPRIGPKSFLRLMAAHGSARAALEALPGIAADAGIEGYRPCPSGVAAAELRAGRRAGATLVALGEAGYPDALAGLDDPPPLLWLRGEPALARRPALAIIGARNASSLGLRMARRLAEGLSADGWVIVSGLARGIDTEAHAASMKCGTVAVMAGGVDVIYPPENRALVRGILDHGGLLVSEQPPGLRPQARHFPRRNRLVSGIARGVVVVEAASGSGSLITARLALDQGREVLAVPGHPLDARAAGCNQLLRDGATLVRGPEDVLEALGRPGPAPAAAPAEKAGHHGDTAPSPAATEEPNAGERTDPAPGRQAARGTRPWEPAGLCRRILERLSPSPVAEDQLIRDLGEAPSAVSRALSVMEVEGRVRRSVGGLLSRAD